MKSNQSHTIQYKIPHYSPCFLTPYVLPALLYVLQVDEYDRTHPDDHDVSDQKKTSMLGAIEIFEKTFWNGLCGSIRNGMRDKSDKIAAMNIDF